jgi:nucleoid DNA-binding protein
VATIRDARFNTTTIEYDTATRTYPVKTTYPQTGAIAHIVEMLVYDYKVGKTLQAKVVNGFT